MKERKGSDCESSVIVRGGVCSKCGTGGNGHKVVGVYFNENQYILECCGCGERFSVDIADD